MPTRNINLTDHFDRFVEHQVQVGKFKNASEVLRAGLRLLEQQSLTESEQLGLLRRLATDGFKSLDQGRGLAIPDEQALRSTISNIGLRAAKSVKQQSRSK